MGISETVSIVTSISLPSNSLKIPFELLAALPVPTGRGHDPKTRPRPILLNKLIVADRIQIIFVHK